MTKDHIPEPRKKVPAEWDDRPPDEVVHVYTAAQVADLLSAERERFPSLLPVIRWLENGGDPKEAATELRVYQQMMGGTNV